VTEPLIVRPEAESDIAEGFDWYEAKRPGLGIEFFAAVDNAFLTIQQHPLAFAKVHREVRRVLVKSFPTGSIMWRAKEGFRWWPAFTRSEHPPVGNAACDDVAGKAPVGLDRCKANRAQ
jgi:plasmid stabilization system protein ParE